MSAEPQLLQPVVIDWRVLTRFQYLDKERSISHEKWLAVSSLFKTIAAEERSPNARQKSLTLYNSRKSPRKKAAVAFAFRIASLFSSSSHLGRRERNSCNFSPLPLVSNTFKFRLALLIHSQVWRLSSYLKKTYNLFNAISRSIRAHIWFLVVSIDSLSNFFPLSNTRDKFNIFLSMSNKCLCRKYINFKEWEK